MTERIYEGPWEEVAEHAPEFTGRRVRLVLLADEPAQNGGSFGQAIAGLLDQSESLEPGKPVEHTNTHEIAFGEIIAEKYRKQGFDI